MRRGHGRLGEEQALGRLERIDAATARLAGHRVEIAGRIVAAQTETETALSGDGPVTSPHVAALARQYGHDVSIETPGEGLGEILDDDLAGRDGISGLRGEKGLAVALRDNDAIDDLGDTRGRNRESRGRFLANEVFTLGTKGEDMLDRLRSIETDGFREDAELFRGGKAGREREEEDGEEGFHPDNHAKSSFTGSLPKSTMGKGRPDGPGRWVSRSKPSAWNIVATMSPGETGRSAGNPPMGSLLPTT